MQPEQSRYERGLDTMRAIVGPGIESALKVLAATSPDLVRVASPSSLSPTSTSGIPAL